MKNKKKPDFSKCRDPEFAEIFHSYIQLLLEQSKKNYKLIRAKK